MLVLQQTTPCFFACQKQRFIVRRVKSHSLRTRATQQEDDHPQNKQQEFQDFQSSWEDHLNIQSKQAHSYRPPAFKDQEIKASGEKFLGRLTVLILGVSHQIPLSKQNELYHGVQKPVSCNSLPICHKLELAGCLAWREDHGQRGCAIVRDICNWSALVGN